MASRPMYMNSHAPNASSIYDYTLETICKTLETNTIPATQKPMYRYLDQAITLFFSDAVREISPTLITRYNTIAQTKIRAWGNNMNNKIVFTPEPKPSRKDLKKQIKILQDQVYALEDQVLFWKDQMQRFNSWIGDEKKSQWAI